MEIGIQCRPRPEHGINLPTRLQVSLKKMDTFLEHIIYTTMKKAIQIIRIEESARNDGLICCALILKGQNKNCSRRHLKYIYFYLSKKIRLDVSRESSASRGFT